jgi:hypothetical protein
MKQGLTIVFLLLFLGACTLTPQPVPPLDDATTDTVQDTTTDPAGDFFEAPDLVPDAAQDPDVLQDTIGDLPLDVPPDIPSGDVVEDGEPDVGNDVVEEADAEDVTEEEVEDGVSVHVTFNAALPASTPDGEDIYVGGSFNAWDPAGTLMTRSGLTAAVTLTFPDSAVIEYKYTRGAWTTVEKGASCDEIANRTVTVDYGTDGTMTVDDTVLNWSDTAPCGP